MLPHIDGSYCSLAWLVIENHDGAVEASTGDPSRGAGQTDAAATSSDKPLSHRQHWILAQLRDRGRVTREEVEKQFDIGEKQAKRELGGLTKRGIVQFIRKPRPGYYVLCTRSTPRAGAAR